MRENNSRGLGRRPRQRSCCRTLQSFYKWGRDWGRKDTGGRSFTSRGSRRAGLWSNIVNSTQLSITTDVPTHMPFSSLNYHAVPLSTSSSVRTTKQLSASHRIAQTGVGWSSLSIQIAPLITHMPCRVSVHPAPRQDYKATQRIAQDREDSCWEEQLVNKKDHAHSHAILITCIPSVPPLTPSPRQDYKATQRIAQVREDRLGRAACKTLIASIHMPS